MSGELPLLPASPSELLGRAARRSTPPPSLVHDLRPGPTLDEIMQRTVDGARRDGAVIARGLAAVLVAVLVLRVIFDAVLPMLLLVAAGGAALVAVIALVMQGVAEGRRQRALLVALAQLSRMARLDPAMRERMAPQIEAVIDALRAKASVLPWASSVRDAARKEP